VYLDYVKYKKWYIALKRGGKTDVATQITEFVKEAERRSQIIYGENFNF